MAYLVTGGTGLLGSRVVRDLAKEGEKVVVYDVSPDDSILKQVLSGIDLSRVRMVQGDVADLAFLVNTLKANNVEKIIHLASLLNEESDANPLRAIRVNCIGTANMFEAARILGLEKVVWASSMVVFGPPEMHSEEYMPNDAPHFPGNMYQCCKDFNEHIAALYFKLYGVDNAAIRFTQMYGLGQRSEGRARTIIRELIENPVLGKPGRLPYGDDVISWLYVDDAARAVVLASKVARTKTRAFNIMGDYRSLKEAAAYLRTLMPAADITLQPGSLREIYGGLCWKFDTSCIEKELGFHTQWSMEKGLKEILDTVRRQHNLRPL